MQDTAFAAVWDPGEAGEGKVKLAADGSLDAVSEWQPARPVRYDGDGATLRIAYVPSGDGLSAERGCRTCIICERERVAALTVPSGRSRLVSDVRVGGETLETHPRTGEARAMHHVTLREQTYQKHWESHQDRGCHLIRPVRGVRRVEMRQRNFGDLHLR